MEIIYKLYRAVDGEWYWWCDYRDPVNLAMAANEIGLLGMTVKIEMEVRVVEAGRDIKLVGRRETEKDGKETER